MDEMTIIDWIYMVAMAAVLLALIVVPSLIAYRRNHAARKQIYVWSILGFIPLVWVILTVWASVGLTDAQKKILKEHSRPEAA